MSFSQQHRPGLIGRLQGLIRPTFTSTRAIRWQLVWILYFMRIERSVRESYERRYKIFAEPSDQRWPRKDGYQRARVAQFPRLPKVVHHYETFSTLLMIVCFAKYALPAQAAALPALLFGRNNEGKLPGGMPPECLVPGRFVFNAVLRQPFALICCGTHVAYRFWVWYTRRPYWFCLIDALLQDEVALDEFYNMHELSWPSAAVAAAAASLGAPEVTRSPRHPFCQFMCHSTWLRVDQARPGSCPCRVRPNMTREVCHRYRLYVASISIFMWLSMAWLTLTLGAFILLVMLLDLGYLYNYPGCDARLGQLQAAGQLSWLSITPTPHRSLMFVFDLVENFVLWVDSGFTLFALFPLLITLNNHVLCYLGQLHKRIESAFHEARLGHYMTRHRWRHRQTGGQLAVGGGNGGGGGGWGGVYAASQGIFRTSTARSRRVIDELQVEICDFFGQVSHMDIYASDIMTMSVLMWLMALMLASHRAFTYYLSHPDFLSILGLSFPVIFVTGLPLAATPTTIVSFVMFELYTSCVRTYKYLCAFVAYWPPGQEKRAFSDTMMEYFIYQNKICYKILRTYPFKATTYFTLVSWTCTSLAMLFNTISRH